MFKKRTLLFVLLFIIFNCSLFVEKGAGIGRDDPLPPDLEISPQSIEVELEIPESSEYGLTVRNTGRNDLAFKIKHQITDQEDRGRMNAPRRDDIGDIIARFAWNNAPMNRYKHAAYDWTNNWMCLSTYSTNWLGAVSFDEEYEEFQVEWAIQPNNPNINPMDFFVRNGVVYCPHINETTCYRFDNNGGLLDGALELPVRPAGMSYSHELELLIVLSDQDWNIHIYEFVNDTEVEEVDRFAWRQGALANAQSHGITWVDMHPDGQLWITAYPANHAYQLLIDTDDWSITEINDRFAWGGNQPWDGIAHDGYNLWLCGYNQAEFQIIDDGVTEAYWLSYEPKEGELESNQEMEVVITLDTEDLIEGDYAAELYFLDGDGDELAVVAIELATIGIPQLEITWDPGFPDRIDFNEQFDPDLFVGGPYRIQANIENIGAAELIIESISLNGDDEMFSVSPTEFNLVPRSEQRITVTFDAPGDEPADYNAVMSIASNDSENEEIRVGVHADAGLPPIIRLQPTEIEADLLTGQIIHHGIEISNRGDAPFWFETEIEITDEPDWGCVPRRDDINFEDETFAVFQDAGAWGWLSDGMMDRDPLVRDHYQSYRNANDWNNIDFTDYDVIIIAGNSQSANFVNEYNRNLERLCEYLDDGGAAYFESAATNSSIRPPGGFTNDQRGAANGVLTVSPERDEENYSLFAEICQETQPDFWDEGEIIEGNAFLNSSYNMDQFDDALDEEVIPWYEKIAEPQGLQFGGVVSYGWGDGSVMLVGHNVGHCWINWTEEGQWGSIGAEILYYLTSMSSGGWATVEPSYGEIAVDGDTVEVDLILNADHLYEGDYEAEVHFYSNDPASPDEVVLVTIHVTPLPDLIIEWELGMGEDGYDDDASIFDWNLYYGTDIFVEREHRLPVMLINDGTTTLTISGISSTEEGEPHFYSDFGEEIVLDPEEVSVVNLLFLSDETGAYPENDDIRMVFYSDDPDEDEIAIRLHATCYEPPVIAINPEEIEEELYGGERVDVAVNISNRGDAPLNWETEVDIIREGRDLSERALRGASVSPNRDDAGEVLYTVRSPLAANNYKHFAYDYDNNWMWHSEYTGDRRVVAMDLNDWNPDEGELNNTPRITEQWNHPGPNPMDFAYYDGVLYWMCLWYPWVQRLDREGNDIGNLDVNLDNTNVNGIAIDAETGMMIVMSNTSPCHLFQFDLENDGERIGRMGGNGLLPGMANEWGRTIDFVRAHKEAPLWSGSINRIHQFEVIRENELWSLGNCVQNFARQATMQYDGIAHDGTNIWSCNYATNVIEVFDDGITEFRWLIWDPMEGSIPGGENSDMIVTVNTSGLTTGDYQALLHILNNDPENPDVEFPVNVNVEGIANIDVTPGGNEFDDEPLDFGICYIGYSKVLQISVENTGTETLEVEGVYFTEGAGYSIADGDAEFVLDPGEDPVIIEVEFEPPEGNRMYEENIGFITSDPRYPFEPREEQFGYPLHVIGNGLNSPEIRIARNAVEVDVPSGDLEEFGVVVQNVGGSPLIFETEVIIIAEPDRDIETSRSLRSIESASAPHRDPGLIATFQMPRVPAQAPTYAKNWDTGMMMLSTYAGFIDIVDPEELEVVRTIQPGLGSQGDCAWLNGIFYVQGASQNWAARFDNNLERLNPDLRLPFAARGIAADNMNGWILIKENGGAIHVFEMDGDELGDEIGSFNDYTQYTNNQDPWTINWVPAHTEGELWVHTPSGGGIMSVDVDTDNWECIGQTYRWADPAANGNWLNGVGHDGNNVWVSVNANATVWIIDDGIHEINTGWLTTNPSEASIEADEELEIALCFNGNRLIEGDYEAEVHFLSNDPVEPDQIVDVQMHIFARPILGRGTDPHPLEWGGETIQFKPVIAGDDNETRFRIALANGGLEDIEIDGMSLDRNQEFEINLDDDQFVIPPFEVFDFDLLFHPDRAGEYSDRLTFFSNAMNAEFDDGAFHFDMTGIGLTHPEMIVDTEEIQADVLLYDEEVTRTFVIGNNADRWGADLDWRITVNIIEEEERDASRRNLRGNNDANAPRRDQPEGRGLLIQNQCGWPNGAPFNFEQYFSAIDGFDYDRYRNWNDLEDVDFNEYDFMWIGNFEQEAWVRDYNQNLERIEEFVDAGGALYHSSGTNLHNTRPINPGGLTYHWGEQNGDASQNDCPLQLNPEDNFLIDYMNENDPYDWEWREGQRLHGNGCAHGVFYEDELDEIENCDWWQIMARGNPTNEPIIVTYAYGRGFCVVSTTTDGFLHNGPASFQWGRTGEAMIWYLDELSSPSWIKVSPKSGKIPTGEETEVTVTFTPVELENYSTYEAELTISSNDPENGEVMIPVTLETGTRLAHFNSDNFNDFTQTHRFHTLNISEFVVNDSPVPDGWEIGVFKEGEGMENNLCGATVWVDGGKTILVYGDDPGTERIEGFSGGDQMSFRAWDPSSGENGKEWRVSVEFTDGPSVWVNRAESDAIITAHPVTQQTLELINGWNLISLNVTPDIQYWTDEDDPAPSMTLMLNEFIDEENNQRLILLKDERGDFCSPDWEFIGINYWAAEEGYAVKVQGDYQLTYTGAPIDAQAEIPIETGWNYVAYYPAYELPCNFDDDFYALNSIIDHVIIAKDANGNFILSEWGFGDLTFSPSQGYQILVDEDVVLTYPEEWEDDAVLISVVDSRCTLEQYWISPVSTGENMSVLITSIAGYKVDDGDQVAAFIGEQLVGTASFSGGMCGLAVWGDDRHSMDVVEGLTEEQNFDLKLWDADKGAIVDLAAKSIKYGDGLMYKTDAFTVLDVRVVESLPEEYSLSQNYPNPFNSVTRLAYDLPEDAFVNIEVFDVSGRKVTNLVNRKLSAGRYSAIWNADNVTSGIYVIRMTAGEFNTARKLMLIR